MTTPANHLGAARDNVSEPLLVRVALIAFAIVFAAMFLVLPLGAVLHEAFAAGIHGYVEALHDDDAVASIKLTLLTAAIAVPLNVAFGVAAAWALTKYEFAGKNWLMSLIDLPFAVSPVISGMVFVLLFGRVGVFANWIKVYTFHPHLELFGLHIARSISIDTHIVYAVPGIVLATTFVTFPFVARELIPLMESQGSEEETAALVLGASGWQIFRRVTLPNIKWALLYGVILCNARAMGEYGAVSVVSSAVAGATATIPLQIETYNSNEMTVNAFSLASVLAGLGIITLIAKKLLEWRSGEGG